MLCRRRFTAATLIGAAGLWRVPAASAGDMARQLADIETRSGGRLGVAVHDTGNGRRWTHHADARFPLNSTFKAFACAALLARVDAGAASLDTRVAIEPAAVVAHSPVTAPRAGTAMSLRDLCAAATAVSDNTAANLVLAAIGGPPGLTAFLRRIGDATTRLDRWEPDLNAATPGDPRDTTTPDAAARSLERLVLGDTLQAGSRRQLTAWLEGNTVAAPLLRASLPASWRIADRSGAGGHGSRGIIAVAWPPDRAPVVIAIYLTDTPLPLAGRDAIIAEVGRALGAALA
ncbi:class A beta-lactamase [Xanthobacter sp. V4C-4]|uniref:class A beta-lactamase n=1 Tax=Xanthobacter cornucopiae TaxID=3119924 RepID=UPI00372AE47A